MKGFKNKGNVTIITIIVALIVLFMFSSKTLIKREQLDEYKEIGSKLEKLNQEYSEYEDNNYDDIQKYEDLSNKFEEIEEEYENYKDKYPEVTKDDIASAKEEVDEYYKEVVELEEAKKDKYKNESSSSSSSNSYSSNSSSSGSDKHNNHNHDNSSNDKHIGKSVYIAKGNSYYHAISNCKYLEGAKTSYVTLTYSMDKHECNCWTNPVPYKKPSSSSSSGSSSSGGKKVYIASGNSYYHKSPSCKFLDGASTTAVSIKNVGRKHACNCIKY